MPQNNYVQIINCFIEIKQKFIFLKRKKEKKLNDSLGVSISF
jgi:hypothetical protein